MAARRQTVTGRRGHTMRSALDKLVSGAGLLFVGDQVHDQLVMQDITMPAGDALGSVPEADAKALEPYAGSTLDTGAEAKAFADHYILAHMNASSDGRTYEEVSGEYIALSDE